MQISPYVSFKGNCEEAFKFYEKAIGGKDIVTTKYRDSPMASQIPADWQDKVMHGQIVINGQTIMGSDPPPEHFSKPQGVALAISVDQPEQAERIFRALAENAKVNMEIKETFWAKRFGMLEDQFGIGWMVNCPKTA